MGALIKDEEQPAEGPLPKYDPPKKVQITFPENTVKLFLIYNLSFWQPTKSIETFFKIQLFFAVCLSMISILKYYY